MRGIPRLVWVLAAGRFVNSASSFMTFYLFVYLTGPGHVPLRLAGLISGALGLGLLLGNLTGGRLSDRYGHRRVLLAASTLTGLCTLAIPWQPAALLAVTLPLIGYAGATAGVSQGALAALAVPVGDRRRSVAVSRAALNAGAIIGPLCGALLAASHFWLLFVLDGACTLLVRVATARLLPATADAPPAAGRASTPGLLRSLRTNRGLLVLLPAVVVVDVVYRQLYSTLPVYLRDHHQPLGLYATLIAVGSGMILCLELPAAMLLRRRPALTIVATGYCLVGIGAGLFALGAAPGVVIVAMMVLTVGEILYKTTATAHVLDSAPPGMVGQYQGLYTGAATSGTMLAPPLGAVLYGAAPDLLWPVCLAAATGAGLLAWCAGRTGDDGGGRAGRKAPRERVQLPASRTR
jgi:MFS family permease